MPRGRPRTQHPEGRLVCSRCKEAKEYSQFGKGTGNTGHKAYCLPCSSEYAKHYYESNKAAYKGRYESKREQLIEYQKQWYADNRVSVEQYRGRYYALLCNVLFKNAQNRWSGVVTQKSLTQVCRFNELLGCNKHELLERFRSLYTEGMSDMNYGEWEIDHIRPICSFDLTDMGQMKQCFHYTNMQPLWRVDNQSKGISWNP